jgi:hypothetical protein
MISLDNNTQAFLALVRAGLWADTSVHDSRFMVHDFEQVDWDEVYLLASEQSVVGVVLAGIERYKNLNLDLHLNQKLLLQWIGEVQLIEQQNKDMNEFVARLIEKLRREDVYAILVKGQGVGQCYEKPLWRSSGDVDLLLSDSNYEHAKQCLLPLALKTENEFKAFKHQGLTMEGDFVVELHGSMHSRLSKKIDSGIDAAQRDVFYNGSVRSWETAHIQIFLPSPDNDVIFVFTHILHHYFIDGIGLRQICDWCRLLWTYRSELDMRLLDTRIRKMGLMTEWKAFGAFAVEYLGMPVEAMPFYDSRFKAKGAKIMAFVLESGNFGHNRQRKHSDSYVGNKALALCHKFKNFRRHLNVFPLDSVKFFFCFVLSGLDAASRKE